MAWQRYKLELALHSSFASVLPPLARDFRGEPQEAAPRGSSGPARPGAELTHRQARGSRSKKTKWKSRRTRVPCVCGRHWAARQTRTTPLEQVHRTRTPRSYATSPSASRASAGAAAHARTTGATHNRPIKPPGLRRCQVRARSCDVDDLRSTAGTRELLHHLGALARLHLLEETRRSPVAHGVLRIKELAELVIARCPPSGHRFVIELLSLRGAFQSKRCCSRSASAAFIRRPPRTFPGTRPCVLLPRRIASSSDRGSPTELTALASRGCAAHASLRARPNARGVGCLLRAGFAVYRLGCGRSQLDSARKRSSYKY